MIRPPASGERGNAALQARGDVAMKLRKYLPTGRVGHLQIAGVQDRHESDTGELYYPYPLELIDELGWSHPIDCEYRPRYGTRAGLGWLRAAYSSDQRSPTLRTPAPKPPTQETP